MIDVHVLGAGPAGAAASLLLASWGHRVRLVTKAGADPSLAVSIPPSCAKLFDAIGIAASVERAGFVRSTGNTVWWGGAEARVEAFASGQRGWQLAVSMLSQVIRAEAIRAGVQVEHRVVDVVPEGLVLDCTGRSGLLARARGLRRPDPGPRTIALVGEWRREDPWDVPDESHTIIESYDNGWMWSVPLAGGVRHICAMIDPRRSQLERGGSALHVYRSEIARSRVFSRLVDGATLSAGPWGWDASQYDATDYAGEGWLLVGDAGSFVDPLSSAGVKKALASAWLAAIVAHTCLATPALSVQARAFYAAREREMAAHLFQQRQQALAEGALGHRGAFWADRADDDRAGTADDGETHRAFERLKSADTLRARAGDVRIEPRACVRDRLIVLEPHIVSAEGADVRHIRNVDIVRLVELAPQAPTVPDLFAAYNRQHPPVALPDFLFALAALFARGWLVQE